MLLNKIVLSKTPPTSPNTVWAKPLNGGVSLYTYSNNKWGPIQLMDDMGTDNPDDDQPGKVITQELFDETIQGIKDYVSENYVSNIKVLITTPPETLNAQVGYYYYMGGSGVVVDTMTIQLPAIADKNKTKNVQFFMTMGSAPEVTFVSAGTERILYQKDFALEAERSYEVNALWNGHAWVITVVEIIPPFFAKLSLNNGEVVKLQGSGELTQAMISPYKKSLVSAEIGELCTSIGDEAFSGCSDLTSITIPSSVTTIGESAFYSCKGLTSITIPDSVTSIGNWAFYSCKGLTSITIPDSVTSIDDQAFNNCTGLISITIPDSIISIGDFAFSNCKGLTSVSIPDSVTSIGVYAFNSCTSLTSITIPNSVTSIGDYAFNGCTGLTSITIPDSVTSIGSSAVSGCDSLTSIVVDSANTVYDSRDNCNAIINTSTNELITGCKNTVIPSTVTSIGYQAFSSCTGLTSVTIPNSVTSIGNQAFSSCTGLTSVTIPDSVTSIGEAAFNQCYSLTSITIPNSVTSIGVGAFNGCTGLTSVTIGNGVTSIGWDAFNGCTGLTSITSLATKAPTIDSTTFDRVKTGGTLRVPIGSTGYDEWMSYLDMYGWTKVEQ